MRTVYLRVNNPNWAKNSAALIAVDEHANQFDCGNIMVVCGPDNHYQHGVGASVCGGYNRHIGFNPTHKDMLV
jgi:hypothetical protein